MTRADALLLWEAMSAGLELALKGILEVPLPDPSPFMIAVELPSKPLEYERITVAAWLESVAAGLRKGVTDE